MSTSLVVDPPLPGFSFDNCRRNYEFIKQGMVLPTAIKTGTTIVGIIYKDGVVLGADTRATEGPIVADKNCEKIHRLQDNLYCCGAGTAADTDKTTQLISSQLEMHRLNTNRIVPVAAANQLLKQMLYRYQGHIGAYLLLGGVDDNGPHIYSIYAHGSSDKLPYSTLGSGSLAAMSVFESEWKENLEEKDAIKLVERAIMAGVLNDLGSGSNVDTCVIRNDTKKAKIARSVIMPQEKNGLLRRNKERMYGFKNGTTRVLSVDIKNIEITEEVRHIGPIDVEMEE